MIDVRFVCNNSCFSSVGLFDTVLKRVERFASPKFRKISCWVLCAGAAGAALGILRKIYRFAPYSAITAGGLLAAASVIRIFWKGSLSVVQREEIRMNQILAEARAAEAERAEAQSRLEVVLRERDVQRVSRADVGNGIIEAREKIAHVQRLRFEFEKESERGREQLARDECRLAQLEKEIRNVEEEIRRIKAHNPEKEVWDFILRVMEFRRGKADSPEMRESIESQIVNVREDKKVFEEYLESIQKEILKSGEKIVACREELRLLGEKRGTRVIELIAECVKLETELREQFRNLSREREGVFFEWVEGSLRRERLFCERIEQGKATLAQAGQIQERCRAEKERCLVFLRENLRKSENLEKLKSKEIKKAELLQTYKEKISPVLEEILRISKGSASEEDREIVEIFKQIWPILRDGPILDHLKVLKGRFETAIFELEDKRFGKEFCEREMRMLGREKEILEIVESFFCA